jgi:hypothetical protein
LQMADVAVSQKLFAAVHPGNLGLYEPVVPHLYSRSHS